MSQEEFVILSNGQLHTVRRVSASFQNPAEDQTAINFVHRQPVSGADAIRIEW
jgi:hypothetical protein